MLLSYGGGVLSVDSYVTGANVCRNGQKEIVLRIPIPPKILWNGSRVVRIQWSVVSVHTNHNLSQRYELVLTPTLKTPSLSSDGTTGNHCKKRLEAAPNINKEHPIQQRKELECMPFTESRVQLRYARKKKIDASIVSMNWTRNIHLILHDAKPPIKGPENRDPTLWIYDGKGTT